MIKDNEGIERYSVHKDVYAMLMRLKQKINHEDQEAWLCFGGDTGTGKSLKSMHWMFPIFSGLKVEHICFDREEFISAVLKAKKGEGIICDESISIFFSRASMTKEGRLVSELAAQIRQKNLAVFLNIPEVMTLDWTIQRKLNAYVHVWENRCKKHGRLVTYKGNAAIYPEMPGNPYKTRILYYLKQKKANPMRSPKRPSYWATVPGKPIGATFKKPWYPTGEKLYRDKKESILEKYKPGQAEVPKRILQRDKAIWLLHSKVKMTQQELSKQLDLPRMTIMDAVRRYKAPV